MVVYCPEFDALRLSPKHVKEFNKSISKNELYKLSINIFKILDEEVVNKCEYYHSTIPDTIKIT